MLDFGDQTGTGILHQGQAVDTSDGKMHDCTLGTKTRKFLWNEYFSVGPSWQFKTEEFAKDFLPHDTLTLKCHLKFKGALPQYESGLRKLSEKISHLYDHHEFSDLTLYTSEREFSLHQTIVCQRAPGFLKDLGFQFENSENNRLKVNSISTSALKALLRYLYSGCLDELPSEILLELYQVAKKYQLVELSELICSLDSLSTLYTQIKVVRKNIKWNILDVNKNVASGIRFYKYINLEKYKFLVKANLIKSGGCEKQIDMRMQCISKLEKDLILSCKVSLRFPGKDLEDFGEMPFQFFVTGNEEKNITISMWDSIKDDGSLQLFLNLVLSDCEEFSSVEGIIFTLPERPSIFGMGLLSCDLATQFENNQTRLISKNGDVTLVFGDKKIYANKAILSSWSPIFSGMFHHDMVENKTDEVVIVDIDHRTARRLIRYMYSGIITQQSYLEDSKLYTAADKYQISSLFRQCSEFLLSEISVLNACEILVLADMHSDNNLFELVLKYIQVNQKEIMNSIGWKLLSDKNFRLASIVLEAIPVSQ